jgi:hypothetical protein
MSTFDSLSETTHEKIAVMTGDPAVHRYESQGKNIYILKTNSVHVNNHYLTNAQKSKIFDLVIKNDLNLSEFLKSLTFESEIVILDFQTYMIPKYVYCGSWPGCDSDGLMCEDGRIHT